MPSKSSKQHRFMGAIAHNPSFAKKAGVPVSVGKHFIDADKGKKFKEGGVMKRKMKYADGGMLGSAPGMTPVGQPQPALQSQKQNLGAGLLGGQPVGQAQTAVQAQPHMLDGGMPYGQPQQNLGAGLLGGQPVGQTQQNLIGQPTLQSQPQQNLGAGLFGGQPRLQPQRLPPGYSGQLQYGQGQGMAPPPRMGNPTGGMMSGILHGQPQQAGLLGEQAGLLGGGAYSAMPASPQRPFTQIEGTASSTPPKQGLLSGIKRGGQISKYAKGGKIAKKAEGGKMDGKMDEAATKFFAKKGEKKLAAHEKRESQGKEKDTKAIAKKEEKVLKGAPKALREYEQKEHKAMGFREGGCTTKTMKRGGKTGPRMRKPNIGKALAAAQMLGAMAPPPSAAAAPPVPDMGMPGMPGMAGAPPSGMPGMKKGGNVIHHHHYAKGGSIGKGVERKGSTKVKMVKMASGGHVGSQPGRRGDGIAQKGRTRCKVC